MPKPRKMTVILEKLDDQYMAKCLEVDVVSQGKTIGKALDSVTEAVGLYLEKKRKVKDILIAQIEVNQ
ncbi:MAG: type II toxin-antitoxin system HicB family antitoxin [Candidatus Nanoarchaeia archaeon]